MTEEDDGSDSFNARWVRAVVGLCREHGLDPETTDLADFIALVERLLRDYPEGSQRSACLDGLEFLGRELARAAA